MIKYLNKSIMAYAAGLALIIGGVAFTPVAESEWGYDQSTGQYYDVNHLPPNTSYQCSISSEVCTQIYDGDPNMGGTLVRDEKVNGTFELIVE